METSLTVDEADEMLKELAAKGGISTSGCAGEGSSTGCGSPIREPPGASSGRSSQCFCRNTLMVSFRTRKGFSAREIWSIG